MKLSSKNNLIDNLVICFISFLLIIVFLGLQRNNLNKPSVEEKSDPIIEEKFNIYEEIENYSKYYNVINIKSN